MPSPIRGRMRLALSGRTNEASATVASGKVRRKDVEEVTNENRAEVRAEVVRQNVRRGERSRQERIHEPSKLIGASVRARLDRHAL